MQRKQTEIFPGVEIDLVNTSVLVFNKIIINMTLIQKVIR